VAWS
jgi:hypothetical protein